VFGTFAYLYSQKIKVFFQQLNLGIILTAHPSFFCFVQALNAICTNIGKATERIFCRGWCKTPLFIAKQGFKQVQAQNQ
jgi:hypothetical protein